MRPMVLIGLLVLISACNAVPQVTPNPDQTTIPGTIRNAYGETIAWPPEVDTPDSDEVSTLAASDLGCVSPTGPIRRVYTLANQNVNYLSSTVTLPAASAITNVPADSTAYVYSGGASNTNQALDAGLQYSTTFGNWSPFFAVSRPSTTSPTGSEKSLYIPKASINPVGLPGTGDAQLRLDGGQTFTLEVWTTDTEIVIKIAPIGTGMLTWRVAPNGVVVMNSQTRYFKYAVGVTDISGRVAPAAENPADYGGHWTELQSHDDNCTAAHDVDQSIWKHKL